MPSLTCTVILIDPPSAWAIGRLDIEMVDTRRADAAATVVGRCSTIAATDEVGTDGRSWVIDMDESAAPDTVQAHWALASDQPNAVGNYRTMEHIGIGDAAWRGEEVIHVRLRRIG